MTIYSVDLAPSEDTLEIKVSAVNLEGAKLDGDYFCNITVIGTPAMLLKVNG
jgi:hypothetical protein